MIAGVYYYLTDDGGTTPVGPTEPLPKVSTLRFKVTDVQSNPTIEFAKFKYNKQVAFMLRMDDSLVMQLGHAFPVFNGGVSQLNGKTYPGLSYTDGAGKKINFKATLAMILGTIQESNAGNINIYTWPMVRQAFAAGWRPSNHTPYHGGGPYPWDSLKNAKLGEQILFDATGYRVVIMTTPASDIGYARTAQVLGYEASCTSQNESMDNTVYNNTSYDKIPAGYFVFDFQYFGDAYTADEVAVRKSFRQTEVWDKRQSSGKPWVGGELTHGPGDADRFEEAYSSILTHPSNTNGDLAWVPPVQEFVEYFRTKEQSVLTKSIDGDVLTITIDQSALKDNHIDRGISALVSNMKLVSLIDYEGADEVTFNASTGLINMYKMDMSNVANPSTDILPAQIVSVSRSGSSLNIVYDKDITQSLASGYTVSGKTCLSVSGSAKNWKVNFDTAITANSTFSYRIYNGTNTIQGDAVTVESGLQVCDYINYPIS